MPPRRRAVRVTARKSTGTSPIVKPSATETTITNSPSDTTLNTSCAISADVDISVSATATASLLSVPVASPLMSSTMDSTDQFSTPPPLQAASVSTGNDIGESIDKEEPPSDAVFENQSAAVVAEGDTSRKPSVDAVQKNDADSASFEANPKISSETNEGIFSPQPVRDVVEDENDNAAVTSGQDSLVEAAATKEVVVNNGGKAKRIVKKTVKVVKKVIRKVPRRVVKGESDAKVDSDEKDDGLNQNSGLGCAVLNEVETVNVKAGVTVSLNVGDSNGEPVESAHMEIVEEQKSLEAHVEVDKKEAENVESTLMEVDKSEDDFEGQGDTDVAEKLGTAGAMNAEVGKGNVNTGVGDGEVKGRDELELENYASKPEYELEGDDKLGEGIYFSGELEAIERKKRRKTEIFIGGLDKDVKEEDIRKVFEKIGEVLEVNLLMNGKTGKNKGYAFLRYASAVDAKKALEKYSKVEVNIKVSLAKPTPKGKQPKQVAKSVSKEIPKENPKARQGNVRPFDPRTQGRLVMHHHDVHRAERPSMNAELVHLLREQASWRQLQPSLSSGPIDIDYANTLSGRKRPLSILEADPLYSDLRYARSRVEPSFPFAGSSYNSSSPIGGTTSSAYYQHYGGYTSGLLYGTRNFPGNEVGDRAVERSTLYRKY
ncbi:hypothetical protein Ancab_032350 [Ancistrocladus abbreviatus]